MHTRRRCAAHPRRWCQPSSAPAPATTAAITGSGGSGAVGRRQQVEPKADEDRRGQPGRRPELLLFLPAVAAAASQPDPAVPAAADQREGGQLLRTQPVQHGVALHRPLVYQSARCN